ncbi:MAG: choice-of-anchor D domain-containing protein [Ignavibacteria bacterium]|nr:choice-of-anchor D domain-containing protein [Ignavibacteria bacterium]
MLLRVPTDVTTPCFTLCARLVVIMRFIATPSLRTRSSACAPLGCYFLLIAFLVVGSFSPLGAQSLSFFFDSASAAYNAQNFPRMRASVRAFDARGQQITSKLDFRLAEDGVQRTVADYVCPTQQAKPVSAVLTIDISGSMGVPFNGTTRLKIAQEAANAFVGALATDGSECGIVAFETNSYPFQDFTTDKGRLTQVVNGLSPLNGTNYQLAFSGNPGGALTMLERAKNSNRAVIFLTDGLSTANYNQVIQQAKQVGATVYCITIGFPVPPVLDTIARATGGEAFSNVQSKDEAIQIYRELANRIRLNTPCVVEWTTDLPCRSVARSVVLTALSLGVSASLSYIPPVSLESQVAILPRAVAMGSLAIGQSISRPVSLQLNTGAQDLVIRRIRSSDNAFRVLEQNFTLVAGQPARSLNVQYTAQDSGYRFATLTVETDNGCTFDFYATSGFPGVRPATPTLVLTHPNGGETFLVGTDTVITWKGLPPSEEARLDYSIDGGKTWIVVDTAAKNLRRPWRVPNTPSDNCYMRVQQKNSSGAAFFGDSAVALIGHKSSVNSAQFNKEGDRIVTASDDRTGIYWNAQDKFGQFISYIQIGNRFSSMRLRYATFNSQTDIIFGGENASDNVGIVPGRSLGFGNIIGTSISALGNSAIRSISANPSVPDRFLVVTESPNGGIYIHDNRLPGNGTSKLVTVLRTSDASLVYNAHYTPPISIVGNNGQASLFYGIIGALQGFNDGVRLWLFGQDEATANLPIRWASNVQASYVDAISDPSRPGNLRIAVACTDNRVRFLTVVVENGNLRLEQDMTISEIAHPLPIKMLSFDPSGNFLVTVGGNQAFIWQVGQPSQLQTVLNSPAKRLHKANINTAFFSPDGSRVVTASQDNDTNVVVWFVREKLPLQEDRSNNLWRIVRPHLVANDIDVGKAIVGNDKDTTHLVLTNPDLYSVPVTKVWFKKANSPFSIVSGGAPFTVNAATPPRLGLYNIEFRFHPLVEGRGVENTDSVFFQTIAGDTLRAKISGEGVLQRIQISTQSIDWRERFVNIGFDTVQAVVRNVSTVPVTFSLPTVPNVSGTFIPAFSILGVTLSPRSTNNGGIITLAVGDSIVVNLRFTAPYLGLIGAPLQFITNQPGEPPTVQLLGTGVQAGPRLSSTITALPMVQTLCTQPQPQDIPLPNTGTQALVIDSMRVVGADGLLSRDFQILTQTPLTIQVNDQGSQSARLRFTPQAVGTTFATLIVYSNSISGVMRIPLQGRLEQPLLVFSTRSVVFSAVNEQQPSNSITIRVENKGNVSAPWNSTPVTFTDQDGIPRIRVVASPFSTELLPNAVGNLTLTFLGGTVGKTYTGSISLEESAKCFSTLVTQWSATVKSSPRLQITVPQLLTTCESSATMSISVRNTGTSEAKNVKFTPLPRLPNVQFSDSVRTIPTNGTFTLQVQVSPLSRADTTRFLVLIESTTSTMTAVEAIQRDTVPMTVIKQDVGLRLSKNSIVFPTLDANITTQETVTIYNGSNQALALPQRFLAGTVQFNWQAQSVVRPYDSVVATVRFNGAAAGLAFQDSIIFTPIAVNGMGCAISSQTLRISASTLPPSTADLVFENFYAAPGDTAQTKVFLRNRARVPIGTVITDTIRYNVSLLQPLLPLPFGEVWLGERKIPVSFEVKSDDPTVPLATLRFRAALGNDTSTVLRLQKTPETRVPKMTINASTATFRLVGISRAGGLRLVIATMGTLRIVDARPNPASTELTLEFTSHDAEEYTLNLINALGVRPDPMLFAEQRFTSMRGLNTRVLDVSRLPSGIYFIQLRNGRELAARKVIIVR